MINRMSSKEVTFAFIRHGEYEQLKDTPSAFQPFGLTEAGIQQAKQAGDSIRRFAQDNQLSIVSTLYSSNLLRAWQTASLIGNQLESQFTVSTTSKLNERSVGSVANLNVTQIETILEADPRYQKPDFNWKSNSHYCLPFDGAESLMQAGERVATTIEEILQSHTDQKQLVVIVGHGASFRHAAHKLGVLAFEDIAKLSMHYADPIYFRQHPETQKWVRIAGDWKYRTAKIKENLD